MSKALKLAGVTLPGSGYPRLVNFLVPDFPHATGLRGLYMFGVRDSLSLPNRANAAAPLAPVGSAAYGQLGATVSPTGQFNTNLPSYSAGLTMIAIAKPVIGTEDSPANGQLILSNYVPAIGDSFGFTRNGSPGSYVPAFKTFVGTDGSGVQSAGPDLSAADPADWNIFAGRIRANGRIRTWWGHDGTTTATVESSTFTRAIQAPKMAIGNPYFTRDLPVLMVAYFEGEVSDSDMTDNIAHLRDEYGPQLGITTL